MGTSVLTPAQEKEAPEKLGSGGGGGRHDDGFGRGGGDGNSGGGAPFADVPVAGIWVAIIAIVMFFAALASAWVALKSRSGRWIPTALPSIVYLDSVILLISSLTLEFSRGCLSAGFPRRFLLWLYATLALGIAFIAGQLIAWHDLARRGVYLATDPSAAFFYLLTAAHGLHLLGGIAALLVAAFQGPRIAKGLKSRKILDVTAIYWHFMYALWISILLLLVLQV
ncbi:MAG TPA: cytochrome c oxidase subunit 3 [Terriglobia bacterium]|nr:cytochrome c oxidase subunit 3 [Terriglobia bacterium]